MSKSTSRLDIVLNTKSAKSSAEELTGVINKLQKEGLSAKLTINETGKASEKTAKEFKNLDRHSKELSGGLRGVSKTLATIQGPLGGVAGRFSSLASNISTNGLIMVGILGSATAAIYGMSKAYKYALDIQEQYNRENARTSALLKATNDASGFTARQLQNQASQVALNTLQSVKGVQEAQQVLLTFRSVSGQTFKQAISLSADLAAIMGTDVKSAALQLGKALDDPTQGLTALRRSGVSFTETQQTMIKNMVTMGDKAKAQKLIIKALADQISGAGKADASTLSGAFDTLDQRLQEFAKGAADSLGLGKRLSNFVRGLASEVHTAQVILFPTSFNQQIKHYRNLITEMQGSIQHIKQTNPNYKNDSFAQRHIQSDLKAIKKYQDAINKIQNSHEYKKQVANQIAAQNKAHQKSLEQQHAAKIAAEKSYVSKLLDKADPNRAATRTYKETLAALKQDLKDGAISQKKYNTAVKAAKDIYDKTSGSAKKQTQHQKEINQQLKQAAKDIQSLQEKQSPLTKAINDKNKRLKEADLLFKKGKINIVQYAQDVSQIVFAYRQAVRASDPWTKRVDHLNSKYIQHNQLLNSLKDQKALDSYHGPDKQGIKLGINQNIDNLLKQGKPKIHWLKSTKIDPYAPYHQLQTDKAKYNKWYHQRLAMLKEFEKKKYGVTKQAKEAEHKLEKKHAKTIAKMDRQSHVARIQGTAQLFGRMGQLTAEFAGNNARITKAMLAFQQGASLAKTIMNITTATGSAAASEPFPANLIAMASVVAQTAGLVSTIASVRSPQAPHFSAGSYSGAYDKGGLIPSGQWGIAGEYGPEIVQGPAKVTSRKDTAKMFGSNITMPVTVHVQAQSGMSQQDAAQQGKVIGDHVQQVVKQTLIQEQRPGGLLYKG